MYAIIETGGKQYAVAPGDKVRVEKLEGEPGHEVTLDNVLLLAKDEQVTVGTPTVAGTKVTGTILSQGRGRKVLVFKMRRRKNYRRKQGHRQAFTEIQVTDIVQSA